MVITFVELFVISNSCIFINPICTGISLTTIKRYENLTAYRACSTAVNEARIECEWIIGCQ